MSTAAKTHRAGAREWLGLAVLALPTLLLSIDVSVLHLAVPHIGASLEPSAAEMLWIIDIYGFMIAGLLVTMGTLGDRIGRRRLLLSAPPPSAPHRCWPPTPPTDHADRRPGAARHRRGHPDAVDAGADQQHVPGRRSSAALAIAVWVTASPSASRSARSSAACCWSTSGGARCSCSPCR